MFFLDVPPKDIRFTRRKREPVVSKLYGPLTLTEKKYKRRKKKAKMTRRNHRRNRKRK